MIHGNSSAIDVQSLDKAKGSPGLDMSSPLDSASSSKGEVFSENSVSRSHDGGMLSEIDDISASLLQEGEKTFACVCQKVKEHVGEEVYFSWFKSLKLAEYSTNFVKLSVPTAFLRFWLNNHYLSLLTDLWQQENPEIIRVDIIVRSASSAHQVPQLKSSAKFFLPAAESTEALPISSNVEKTDNFAFGSPLDNRYSFDNFIEGRSNQVVLAAARSVADLDRRVMRFNPLFIHASVGLGKTHLLQAIAAAALNHPNNYRVVYLTAEYFMWRFATAIKDNEALSFKKQLRDIDLLIIDDLQFLQGKSIQNEFCHLLNLLLDSAKQVVIAADRAPSELESLDERVRSRLLGGVALEIESPDYEMRLQMLRQKAQEAHQEDPSIVIPDDILVYVAQMISGSGRDIEGAFNQIVFRRSFEPELTYARIDEMLGHLTRTNHQKRIRIEEIQRVVARHYHVSKQDLLSTRRTRVIVKPRQIAMYLAKHLTSRSLPEIGRRFGGRDHTTVLHAVRKIETMTDSDEKLSQEIELLKRLIHDQA